MAAEAHFAFDPPHSLFIAIENWVGLIDLQDLLNVEAKQDIDVVGFVKTPQLPIIRDIAVRDDVAYVVGGYQLVIMTAAFDCYWFPITSTTLSFAPQNIELEGERLYVGGIADGELQIEAFNLAALPVVESLGSFALPPAIWSVVGDQLLTYNEQRATVTVTDVTDLEAVTTRDVPLPLDPAWQLIGRPQLVADALSLVVIDKGLVSITGLLMPEPTVVWHELPTYYSPIGSHTAQATTLFVAFSWADANRYNSSVWVSTRDEQVPLREISLYPHFPVFHFYAIRDDLVFAFSDYSLIVIDLTAPVGQEIVRTYPLRGRLDQ